MGTASVVATNPLKRIPIFINSPRRETVFSFDIIRPLVLLVLRNRVRLAWSLSALRGEPGDDIGDFLIRHRLAGHISPPVRRSQFRAPGDDNGAQSLIADQRKKGIIGDGASPRGSVAARAVTGFAVGLVCEFSARDDACRFRSVARWIRRTENSGTAPTRSDFASDHVNLLARQHAATALCEGRHRSAAYAAGNDLANRNIVRDSQINGIGTGNGRSPP